MNIKSLLLGSAAALAAVSGAQAADAIVAAEPEPVEYVRVCDAFGTGYFYIPGTETCLKVGGYVRFQIDAGDSNSGAALGAGTPSWANSGNSDDWDVWTRGRLAVTAKNDTELGTLTSFIAIHAEAGEDNNSVTADDFYFDEVYLQLGGFKAGSYLTWWDKGINGETDTNGQYTRANAISYTYTGSAFSAGVQLEEISRTVLRGRNGVGVSGIVSGKFGGVSVDLLGSYDVDAEDGAIRALVSAPVGPGTLQALLVWSSGEGSAGPLAAQQVYWNISEWSLAASYAFKATDKLTITPGAQYFWNSSAGTGEFKGDDFWRAGVTVDYQIVSGLAAKVSVQYEDKAYATVVDRERDGDRWFGFVRLQRDF